MHDRRAVPAEAAACLLGASQARRVLVSLIEEHQSELLRDRRISPEHAIRCVMAETEVADPLPLDEARMGYDSLLMIELVARVTRFLGLDQTGVEDLFLVQRTLSDWARLTEIHFQKVGVDAVLTFRTSGSTSTPSSVPRDGASLWSEIEAIVTGPLVPWCRGAGRILCHVEPRHIYGFLWSVLLAERCGATVIDLPRALPSPVLREARPGDLVISTPYGWERMAETGQTFPEGVIGVTSGAAAGAETWRASEDLGLERLIEVYGSTETGGLGWRENGTLPFQPMADVDLRSGELAGPRFREPAPSLQDRLRLEDDGHFHVLGRLDAVVQVAGTNVNLADVTALLKRHRHVTDAAVRLDEDRLKAFIVTRHDASFLEAELRAFCAGHLAAPARPARFTFGDALPRASDGKLRDW